MLERIHLSIVQQVEQQGSLTAAAGVLNLTQSALSHSMKKLEQQLGTDVWLREGRSLRLTQAGQYLLAVANRVLPQLDLAEERLGQFAQGERGALRIGMECHPCYQWLLKIVSPYLAAWPDVDVDVKQKFQFGGIGALFGYEIDLLVTPDPLLKPGLKFIPVFDYEQVLVVASNHALAKVDHVKPRQLGQEVLISYPVPFERLDIYNQFLLPAGITPRRHKAIETTDILMQMVASGRGVAAMPRWLVEEYATRMDVVPVRLGAKGIPKQIYLGAREADTGIDYLQAFIELARNSSPLAGNAREARWCRPVPQRTRKPSSTLFHWKSARRPCLRCAPRRIGSRAVRSSPFPGWPARMTTPVWPPCAPCARSDSSRCRISLPAASGQPHRLRASWSVRPATPGSRVAC